MINANHVHLEHSNRNNPFISYQSMGVTFDGVNRNQSNRFYWIKQTSTHYLISIMLQQKTLHQPRGFFFKFFFNKIAQKTSFICIFFWIRMNNCSPTQIRVTKMLFSIKTKIFERFGRSRKNRDTKW